MQGKIYTVEELMCDESFVNFCLNAAGEETLQWKMVMDALPEQKEVFEQAAKMVWLLHGKLSKEDVEQQVRQVQGMLLLRKTFEQKEITGQEEDSKTAPVKSLYRRFLPLTAVAAAVIIVFTLFFFNGGKGEASVTKPLAVTKEQSSFGQRRKLQLPDGTTVTLNSLASITWDENYNKQDRRVSLSGSAFFEVAKNPAKPFTVTSGQLATTALGTSFYVHTAPAATNTTVSLLEGKIQVAPSDSKSFVKPVIVIPGEEAAWSKAGIRKQSFDASGVQEWLSNKIVFNKTPLQQAVKKLSEWYNVEIILQDKSLAKQTVTATYENQSLQDVLSVICFSLNSNYKIQEQHTIVIY
ncbi:FecR family protein [Foetidibacter luteolus]|uniref:FecR family protein n=1 Tax=Foetidibacter luteolus TaxID=2608880 RepID=UPI00129A87EA|nr:FecR domain-containing protein [Foetidibacter luteolus]